MIVASTACVDRIQAFLESPSRRDHRLVLSTADRGLNSTSDYIEKSGAARSSDVELQPIRPTLRKKISTALTDDAIVVQNGYFSWSSESPGVLHDITFRVKASHFVIIIGPTGCGKSTLLKGVLGETPTSRGFVYATSLEVAFVDQDSWVRNGTFRTNVLGGSTFEPVWYAEVLRASALDGDLSNFADGDHTIVGSRGITLSGGQKQRLALARAVYSKKEILIMDDVFSSLDADTEERIFNRLLGSRGLLKRQRTTIILVTHAGEPYNAIAVSSILTILCAVRRLAYADHIIALGGDGSIVE